MILALTKLSGSDLKKASQTVDSLASRGYRTIGVAVAQGDGPWIFLGILPLLDPPRPPTPEMVTCSTWHCTRWIILTSKAAVGKYAMPATPFSPDSAILHFDYSLHVESRLTVTVYLLY